MGNGIGSTGHAEPNCSNLVESTGQAVGEGSHEGVPSPGCVNCGHPFGRQSSDPVVRAHEGYALRPHRYQKPTARSPSEGHKIGLNRRIAPTDEMELDLVGNNPIGQGHQVWSHDRGGSRIEHGERVLGTGGTKRCRCHRLGDLKLPDYDGCVGMKSNCCGCLVRGKRVIGARNNDDAVGSIGFDPNGRHAARSGSAVNMSGVYPKPREIVEVHLSVGVIAKTTNHRDFAPQEPGHDRLVGAFTPEPHLEPVAHYRFARRRDLVCVGDEVDVRRADNDYFAGTGHVYSSVGVGLHPGRRDYRLGTQRDGITVASGAWNRPVLESVMPVIDESLHVNTNLPTIDSVARWMAYEEFIFPKGASAGPFDLGSSPSEIIDAVMFASVLNFAFTDFETGVKYAVDYDGRSWSDTEGMFVRIHQATQNGQDLFDGSVLLALTRDDLSRIFSGNIELPLMEQRTQILNEVGETLMGSYGGRFHRFISDCAPFMYHDGDGLLERLVTEFPRFNDVSFYQGHQVQIHKLAQLSLWSLHMALHESGDWTLRDLSEMTAFADYIVPVALRLMGIIEYSPDLEARINEGQLIDRDSDEEIEIRAHTLYATALLTDRINQLRPDDLQLVIPQVDYRLWKSYHATTWPHHLTKTIMY